MIPLQGSMPSPSEIKRELDQSVIGQERAKRALSVDQRRAMWRIRARKWRLANPDRAKEIARASYWKNHDAQLERSRLRLLEHRDQINQAQRDRRTRNIDDRRAKERSYARIHRDKIILRVMAWYEKNKDHKRVYDADYRKRNPERERELARAWAKANPERLSQLKSQRRARVRGASGSHTLQEWQEKCELFANRCAYCGEAKRLTRDHYIPLISGGSDSIGNIIPACLSCNCRKGDLAADEFMRRYSRAAIS